MQGKWKKWGYFLEVCADIKFNLETPGMKCIMMESS